MPVLASKNPLSSPDPRLHQPPNQGGADGYNCDQRAEGRKYESPYDSRR